MYTQCPGCQTYFRITPTQLQAAAGKVRCGTCRTVFFAPDLLFEQLPGIAADTAPAQDEPNYERLLREPDANDGASSSGAEESTPAVEGLPPDNTPGTVASNILFEPLEEALSLDDFWRTGGEAPAPLREERAPEADYGEDEIESLLTPSFQPAETESGPESKPAAASHALSQTAGHGPADADVATAASQIRTVPSMAQMLENAPPSARRSGGLWLAGSLLLALVLAAELIYFNRLSLVQRDSWRPALETFCRYTGCSLPARQDLSAFHIIESQIQSHAQYKGALNISGTLQNHADFTQACPAIEVNMRDLDGKIVASRIFQPGNYLSSADSCQLEPQATASIELSIADPGSAVVGFDFAFH